MKRICLTLVVIVMTFLAGCATPMNRDLFAEASGNDLLAYLVSGEPPVVEDMTYMVRICTRGDWIYVQKVDIGGIHYETGRTMHLNEFDGLKIPKDDSILAERLNRKTIGREWQFSPELKKLALQQKNRG